MLHRVLGVVHRVLGVLHRVLGVVHRVLGVLHRVLRVVHRLLGVLHRVLGVVHRVLGVLHGGTSSSDSLGCTPVTALALGATRTAYCRRLPARCSRTCSCTDS